MLTLNEMNVVKLNCNCRLMRFHNIFSLLFNLNLLIESKVQNMLGFKRTALKLYLKWASGLCLVICFRAKCKSNKIT